MMRWSAHKDGGDCQEARTNHQLQHLFLRLRLILLVLLVIVLELKRDVLVILFRRAQDLRCALLRRFGEGGRGGGSGVVVGG